jgi:hypothetical protein
MHLSISNICVVLGRIYSAFYCPEGSVIGRQVFLGSFLLKMLSPKILDRPEEVGVSLTGMNVRRIRTMLETGRILGLIRATKSNPRAFLDIFSLGHEMKHA